MNEAAKRRLRTSRFVLSVYWLTMFIGTHIPKPPEPAVAHLDKAAHFGAYAVLAFLMAFYRGQLGRMTRGAYVSIFVISAVYGAFDELTQSFVPGRSGEWLDWVADVAGAAVGLGAFWLYCRKKQPKLDVV